MNAVGLTLPKPASNFSIGGLMNVKPLSRVLADEAAAAVARATQASQTPVISSLAAQLKQHWNLAKEAKLPFEREMLNAVRSRRGEYPPEVLQELEKQGGSKIYMMIFATKARQMKALFTDVLVAAGADKPWTLRSSPKPDLPPEEMSQIMQAVYEQTVQAEMAGTPMAVADIRQRLADGKVVLENAVREFAAMEAERAEKEVEDVMVEGGWLEALDEFLDDLTVFKTAIMKGPVLRNVNELKWVSGPNGATAPQVQMVKKLQYERVDPFMIYPAPWAKSVHDSFLFERHKLSRGDLSALIGIDGYSEDAIRAVLDQHGTGGLTEWLWVDTVKAQAEGRTTIGAEGNRSDLIDALQYWGSVSGKHLLENGMDEGQVPDAAKEYDVEVWKIGEFVIKAVINPDPLSRRPYYTDGFSRIPGAFWHNSLFDVIEDCQDMANSAARALSNNLGISSGPQAVVNVDRLALGEELTEMYPWKIWQMTNDPMGGSGQPVNFFQPNSNANELMTVFERFSTLADEYSGIPRYLAGLAGGDGGAGRTASGLSMMITNASKQVKQAIASLDMNVISRSVERTYHWLMQYRPDLGLKSDLGIQARGATSLVAKEAAQVRLNEFLTATGNPVDMRIIGLDGRAELLRHAVKRLDLNTDKVVPSATVVKQRAAAAQMAQMQQMAQGQGQPSAGAGQQLMDGAPVTDNFQPA